MMFALKKHTEFDDLAFALRRYVVRRAKGKTAPEYVHHIEIDDGLAVWVGATVPDAAGQCDGKAFKRIRQPGVPWCKYLGTDLRIAEDSELIAFFELYGSDDLAWTAFAKQAVKNPKKMLREWRTRGAEILTRIRIQKAIAAGEIVPVRPSPLQRFRQRGTGLR